MESSTKRILAVVLIAVIGVGIGVGAWVFLGMEEAADYKVPGAPSGYTDDQIIKIGCLGDTGDVTGEGNWKGAYLAAKEINELGGVATPNGTMYFGITTENTYEAEPFLDTTKAELAVERLLTVKDPHYVIGGFRTEATAAVSDNIYNAKKLFMITGAASDSLLQLVQPNYTTHKYLFRVMPINSSSLAKEIVKFYIYGIAPALEDALGVPVTNVAIIRESLAWTIPMSYVLNGYYAAYGYWGLNNNPIFNFTIVDEIDYPITATSTDFTGYLNQFTSSGAQLVCPIISAQGGIKMMTQYNELNPDYMIAGIDVISQLGDDPDDPTGFWHDTNGGCAYEILMQSCTRTNKTTQTIAFWDAYRALWNKDPLYTAVGAYGAINMLKWAIETAGSIDCDDLIPVLETIDVSNPMEGPGGNVAFNANHDLFEGYNPVSEEIFSVTLWVQWLANGTKGVVTSGGEIYPEWIVDAAIQIPPWI